MTLYNKDELERGAKALHRRLSDADYWQYYESEAEIVMDAVLPAIRERWLRELADEITRDESLDFSGHYVDLLRRKADEATP